MRPEWWMHKVISIRKSYPLMLRVKQIWVFSNLGVKPLKSHSHLWAQISFHTLNFHLQLSRLKWTKHCRKKKRYAFDWVCFSLYHQIGPDTPRRPPGQVSYPKLSGYLPQKLTFRLVSLKKNCPERDFTLKWPWLLKKRLLKLEYEDGGF